MSKLRSRDVGVGAVDIYNTDVREHSPERRNHIVRKDALLSFCDSQTRLCRPFVVQEKNKPSRRLAARHNTPSRPVTRPYTVREQQSSCTRNTIRLPQKQRKLTTTTNANWYHLIAPITSPPTTTSPSPPPLTPRRVPTPTHSSQQTFIVTGYSPLAPQSSLRYSTPPPSPATRFSSPCGPGARLTFLCLNSARNISVSASLLQSAGAGAGFSVWREGSISSVVGVWRRVS